MVREKADAQIASKIHISRLGPMEIAILLALLFAAPFVAYVARALRG